MYGEVAAPSVYQAALFFRSTWCINEQNPNMKLRANVNFSTTFLSPRLYEKGTVHLLFSISNIVKYFLYVYCMSNRFQLFLLTSFKKYCVTFLVFLFSNFTLKFR
jgi:hypothetical protein